MLDPNQCRRRQKRLLGVLEERKLDAVAIGHSPHVYYLTGHLPFWQQLAGFVLFADGRSAVVTANKPDPRAAADRVEAYEAQWNSTQRQEQPRVVAEALAAVLGEKMAARIGVDSSAVTSALAVETEADCQVIDADLFQLRRVKDPDELALMKVGIACTKRMYERARQLIAPGVSELHVFNELHAAAVEVASEPLSAFLGNDYACGARGGPPRNNRFAQAGEMYILDLGPAYRGYFSDNCRGICVNRKPTDGQMKAYDLVTSALGLVESMAGPGVRCQEIFNAVDELYRSKTGTGFPHHLGHGVGLQPHEFPHLNLRWDDTLVVGEVFTAEPGYYAEELRAGLRIENQYLVTSSGVENLTPFPMGIV
jgi:Xaa-Pro aminopeptidase